MTVIRTLRNKMIYCHQQASIAKAISFSLENDHCARNIARGFFLSVYRFLEDGLVSRLNNELFKNGIIDARMRNEIRVKIRSLRSDFNSYYNQVRHSFTGHRQRLDFIDNVEIWNAMDKTTIDSLHEQIHLIVGVILQQQNIDEGLCSVGDNLEFLAKEINHKFPKDNSFYISSDSLAHTRDNTICIMTDTSSKEKASNLLSIIDFLDMLFDITHLSQNFPQAHKLIWSLIILDGFNLLENLFVERDSDPSLYTEWKDINQKGIHILEIARESRDGHLEEEMRNVRNHFAAHLDSQMTIEQIEIEFNGSSLVQFASYIATFINSFFEGCREDGRTQKFLIRNSRLNDVKALPSNFELVKSFNN